jgi:metal-responsive CopG/Arc/MetJ family transcriptional regulator
MKTAISLPDDLFAAVESLAQRLGISRSALIAAALAEYIGKHRASKVTERLDAVYRLEDGRLETPLLGAQQRAMRGSSEA